MAYMSAAQGLGFGIGPAFSAAVSNCDFNIGILHIDPYTSVGWLSAFFSLINALALIWINFQELPHATVDSSAPGKSSLSFLPLFSSPLFLFPATNYFFSQKPQRRNGGPSSTF
jgi:hypothetical protein